jgi:hypothetical protein
MRELVGSISGNTRIDTCPIKPSQFVNAVREVLDYLDAVPYRCYRTGDPADERCHSEGCAGPDVDRDEIYTVIARELGL